MIRKQFIFFLHDFVNTNKIFLYQILCHYYRAQNDIVLCVTFLKIAIFLLFEEQISHFRFKISLKITNDTICHIIRNMRLYDFLRKIKLIIWNEVFMQNKHCFTIIHRTFTNLMQNNDIFDDISIIFENDFAQIFSMIKRKIRFQIVDANIQQCFLWSRFKKLFLRQNMRIRIELTNQIFAIW